MKKENPFQHHVLEIVRKIPRGRVATYGQVAILAGTPRAARQVGRILYFYGRLVPWQRVVNHYGGLSTYKVGSGVEQRMLLEQEGVEFKPDGTLDLSKYQWRPRPQTLEQLQLPPKLAQEVNAKLRFTK